MTTIRAAFLFVLSAFSTVLLEAAELSYSSAQLDAFWRESIHDPDLAMYAALDKTSDVQATIKPSESGLGPEAVMAPATQPVVVGSHNASSGAQAQFIIFPVLAATQKSAGLMQRAAMLESYLSKSRLLSKDVGLDDVKIIDKRRNAVHSELYLIHLMRFAHSSTLPLRCQQIMKVDALAKTLADKRALSGTLDVPAEYRQLQQKQEAAASSYNVVQLKDFVCNARRVGAQAELLRMMRQRVAARLTKEGGGGGLLGQASSDFASNLSSKQKELTGQLKAVKDVHMHVSNLIKLSDGLVNISSSFDLVRDDLYGLKKTSGSEPSFMDRLGKLDYKEFKELNTLPDGDISIVPSATGQGLLYQQVLGRAVAAYDKALSESQGLRAILKGYVELWANVPGEFQIMLKPCETILSLFAEAESVATSGADALPSQKAFHAQFSKCLTEAVAAYKSYQSINENQYQIDDGFAKHVSHLSKALLTVKRQAR